MASVLPAFITSGALMTFMTLFFRGIDPAFVVWLGSFVASAGIRIPYLSGAKTEKVVKNKTYDLDQLVIRLNGVAMCSPLVYFLVPSWFGFSDYGHLLPSNAFVFGVALEMVYVVMMWRSHADLGRQWSPTLEVRESHKLITRGVYRYVRHPMYTGFWAGALAQAILAPSLLIGPFTLISFGALYWSRVDNEEAMMRAEFGKAYDEYCLKSTRLVPFLF